MRINFFFSVLLFSSFCSYGQITLRTGESWVYTFPTTASFPQLNTEPWFAGPPQETMFFSIEAGSFAEDTQLQYEIVAGGKYTTDPMADWVIGAVASKILTSAPPSTVSLSYSGPAWLDTFSPGGIRFSVHSGSVVITSVTLDQRFPVPGGGGSGITSHRQLSFVPQPAPWFSVIPVAQQRVQVKFSTNSTGYTLERTTALPTVNPWLWSPIVTNKAAASDPEFTFELELTNRVEFLRLRRK